MSFLKDLKIGRVEGELAVALSKLYPDHGKDFVKVGEKKWFLPYKYVQHGDKVLNFETRPDDTWIITYPRSGTTLTQELIWLVANDMNFDEAHRRPLAERFPFLDYCIVMPDESYTKASSADLQRMTIHSIEFVQNKPSPRFIKSHCPLDLLPTVVNNDRKIIYVARNPKDVVVSLYHFRKDFHGYRGTFEQICNDFINNHVIWSPYWEHVKSAWAIRHKPNMLFLFYEDLTKNLIENIEKIATFFDKTYNNIQIAKLTKHLNIENFRKNFMVNQGTSGRIKPESFIRQGKTGSWKEIFTPELEKRFNEWIADNLKDTDLVFPD